MAYNSDEKFNQNFNYTQQPIQSHATASLPYSTMENSPFKQQQNQQYNPYPPQQQYNTYQPPQQYSQPQQPMPQGNPGQVEAGQQQWGQFTDFTNKNIRLSFIRKVYLILTAQLIFTFGIVCIFVFVDQVKTFAKSDTGFTLYIVSYFLFLSLIIGFSFCQCCCNDVLRTVPYNYIILAAITVTFTYMLAMISAYHRIEAVLMAVGITLLITTAITLFAMQTRFDFTNGCIFVAFCLSFALVGFGIAAGVGAACGVPVLQSVYGGLGAALMALFLAIDTQLLMGNKKYKFSEEDYINAALQLYLDICYMFLYLLQLFGKK